MQKLIYIIILFLFGSLDSYSQNFISYYRYINNAEIFICDSMYTKAINYYDSAFSVIKTPFIKDLKNANLCAIYLKDYEKSYNYIEKLITLGFPLECFVAKDYDNFKRTLYWNKLFLIDSTYHNSKFEVTLKDFKKRFQKEQNLALEKNLDTIRYQKFVDCVIENYNYIKSYTAKNGFPSDEVNSHEFCSNTSYTYFTLLHYYQLLKLRSKLPNEKLSHLNFLIKYRFDYNEIHHLLYDAVLKGKLLPNTFAGLEDIIDPNNYGTLNYIQVDDTCAFINYSQPEIINTNRFKLGLCSLNDAKTILRYKLNFEKDCPFPPDDEDENSVCTNEDKEYERFDLRSGKYRVFYFIDHNEGREFFYSIVNSN